MLSHRDCHTFGILVDCKNCVFGIERDCFIEIMYFLTKFVFMGNKLCTCTEIDFLIDFYDQKHPVDISTLFILPFKQENFLTDIQNRR
jgi:hypothetical protein